MSAWKTSPKRTSTASAPHSSRSLGDTRHHRSFVVPLGIAPSGRRFTSR
jgi:hypothetical protein